MSRLSANSSSLPQVPMRDPIQFAARFLAYSWYRRTNPEASHRRAWRFSGAHWNAFLLQALENTRRERRLARDKQFGDRAWAV